LSRQRALGVEPGPQLRDLHEAIAHQDEMLAQPADWLLSGQRRCREPRP